ncbi:class I SAM-dependent methyltransferase [Ciceribacter thiooxidans]|uniref:Class I SAM-dependent methyltransferase n=1 Tax=Ciceribacter thiooxidans TaxID=1969821 RepID=A0ABV7I8V4_9HYPH|nr:class I SAM-dependent methyltransferase [Ciceribacter thiooxidans]
MTNSKQQKFWNGIAGRYAARPIKDVAAYEAMLADVALRLKPSDRVLELGCGTGGTAIRLSDGVAHWSATDFSSEMIEIARAKPGGENVNFIVADARHAFDDGPFDAICAFNLLHLVDDPPATLDRIFTNLKPGGLLITKTWCFADVGLKLRALFTLLRAVGKFPVATSLTVPQLRQAVLNAGFEIADERIFGKYRQNPYIVARKPELSDR